MTRSDGLIGVGFAARTKISSTFSALTDTYASRRSGCLPTPTFPLSRRSGEGGMGSCHRTCRRVCPFALWRGAQEPNHSSGRYQLRLALPVSRRRA